MRIKDKIKADYNVETPDYWEKISESLPAEVVAGEPVRLQRASFAPLYAGVVIAVAVMVALGSFFLRGDEPYTPGSTDTTAPHITPLATQTVETQDIDELGISRVGISQGRTFYGITINPPQDGNFKNAIREKIINPHAETEDIFYFNYERARIAEISMFYSLDEFSIDGYALYRVRICEAGFAFIYVPVEEFHRKNVLSLGQNNIHISIRRSELWTVDPVDEREICAADPLGSFARNNGWGALNSDNLMFNSTTVTGQLGSSIFHIHIPNKPTDYETFRNIAFDLIEKAEVISVRPEIKTNPPPPQNIEPSLFIFPTRPTGYISLNFQRGHNAIDIIDEAPVPNGQGAPIFAAGCGVVVEVMHLKSGYGHYVLIQHGEDYYNLKTLYAHCDEIYVEVGQEVTRGEQIATIGDTGRTDGPHLHFEVMDGTRRLNPTNYLP